MGITVTRHEEIDVSGITYYVEDILVQVIYDEVRVEVSPACVYAFDADGERYVVRPVNGDRLAEISANLEARFQDDIDEIEAEIADIEDGRAEDAAADRFREDF